MSEAYLKSDPGYDARVTVPVLWDTQSKRIVNNESSDIIRMFAAGDSLGRLGDKDAKLDLYPPALRGGHRRGQPARVRHDQQRRLQRRLCPPARAPTNAPSSGCSRALRWLEELLAKQRYLLGEQITEADWRLFPTLVRFDEVYHLHFRCNYRRIVEYPNLWAYTRELYQWPGVAQTVAMGQIKRHYYTTHDELNPKHIIPLGPAPDWEEPHGRGDDGPRARRARRAVGADLRSLHSPASSRLAHKVELTTGERRASSPRAWASFDHRHSARTPHDAEPPSAGHPTRDPRRS